jgi:pyruvate carboxylase
MTARKQSNQGRPNRQQPTDRNQRIPLRITDTTLRDAHQSLWATRMRTKDIMGIIDAIDQCRLLLARGLGRRHVRRLPALPARKSLGTPAP